jgi:arylsulfatase A-like enzyme
MRSNTQEGQVIWGDDIGITNISHYSRGMMGYPTTNINRIAQAGLLFTNFFCWVRVLY